MTDVHIEERTACDAAVITARMRPEEVPGFLGAAFAEIMAALQAQSVAGAGPPFARYRMGDDGFEVTAGMPAAAPVRATGRVIPGELPGGPTAVGLHRGDYGELPGVFQAVGTWITGNGWVVAADPWESYLDGPDVAQPRTEVCFPVRRA